MHRHKAEGAVWVMLVSMTNGHTSELGPWHVSQRGIYPTAHQKLLSGARQSPLLMSRQAGVNQPCNPMVLTPRFVSQVFRVTEGVHDVG